MSPASSSLGKPPTYTLQKAARMAARVNKSWIRVASVIAYFLAISVVGGVLAVFYIFFYDPYKDCCVDEPDELSRANEHVQPIVRNLVGHASKDLLKFKRS